VTYRPPSGAPVVAGNRAKSGSVIRQARLWWFFVVVALLAAPAAHATPGSISSKEAQAQSVLAQIQGLDANLERAVDAYNLANEKLGRIESDLRENKLELQLARKNLKRSQTRLSARLVEMYTSGNENTGLDVLLGASSIDDLISRLDTMDRVSDQSTEVLRQVKVYRAAVKQRRARLQTAHVQQAELVAERSAQKASIEGQLAERQHMLSSIKDQIADMQAAEQARQAELAAQARARLQTAGATVLDASAGAVVDPPATYAVPRYAVRLRRSEPGRLRLLGLRDVRLRADRRLASAQRGRAVRLRDARLARPAPAR
jgi:peptidoglycan hydrolase CwlO-like protein